MSGSASRADRFREFIGLSNLLGLVRNTAPFLFTQPPPAWRPQPEATRESLAVAPLGYLDLLHRPFALEEGLPDCRAWRDYFFFCLACHHATVATFVPTDVDSKIRGLLWRGAPSMDGVRAMAEFVLSARRWDCRPISRRWVDLTGHGPVSGHDGEWLAVLAGALGALAWRGDDEGAQRVAAAIEEELWREARAMQQALSQPGAELDALRLAISLTHNAGDLDQGISFWPVSERLQSYRARFQRLAHENRKPFGGWFQTAAALYNDGLSAEGHRHYPLRAVKALRRSADLLLPLGPFLDEWGATIATHGSLAPAERAEVVSALLAGCRKIPGQSGYYRALSGFFRHFGGRAADLTGYLPAAARSQLKDPEVRRHLALSQASFESSLRKKARIAAR